MICIWRFSLFLIWYSRSMNVIDFYRIYRIYTACTTHRIAFNMNPQHPSLNVNPQHQPSTWILNGWALPSLRPPPPRPKIQRPAAWETDPKLWPPHTRIDLWAGFGFWVGVEAGRVMNGWMSEERRACCDTLGKFRLAAGFLHIVDVCMQFICTHTYTCISYRHTYTNQNNTIQQNMMLWLYAC